MRSLGGTLIHNSISEDDDRRSDLFRYVRNLQQTGGYGFDLLQIAAVAYLKNLDQLHDERAARLAADQTIAERLESRRAQPDTQIPAEPREHRSE